MESMYTLDKCGLKLLYSIKPKNWNKAKIVILNTENCCIKKVDATKFNNYFCGGYFKLNLYLNVSDIVIYSPQMQYFLIKKQQKTNKEEYRVNIGMFGITTRCGHQYTRFRWKRTSLPKTISTMISVVSTIQIDMPYLYFIYFSRY